MKKNIIIGILILLVAFFAVLSKIKSTEAEKAQTEAMANLELAEMHRLAAEEQEQMTTKLAADAIIARAELEKCKNR